jgi:hypothetical protein
VQISLTTGAAGTLGGPPCAAATAAAALLGHLAQQANVGGSGQKHICVRYKLSSEA